MNEQRHETAISIDILETCELCTLKGFVMMSHPSTSFSWEVHFKCEIRTCASSTFFTARFERRIHNPKFHIAVDILETERIKSTFNEVLYQFAF